MFVTQSCLTLCDLMDCSLPGSSVHGILQAEILQWVAISFSRVSSQPRDCTLVSCIAGRSFTVWAPREAQRKEIWTHAVTRTNLEACMLSCIRLFVTPWTVARQAALSMEFSRQKYWSRFPVPTPGDLPNPWIEIGLKSTFFLFIYVNLCFCF